MCLELKSQTERSGVREETVKRGAVAGRGRSEGARGGAGRPSARLRICGGGMRLLGGDRSPLPGEEDEEEDRGKYFPP